MSLGDRTSADRLPRSELTVYSNIANATSARTLTGTDQDLLGAVLSGLTSGTYDVTGEVKMEYGSGGQGLLIASVVAGAVQREFVAQNDPMADAGMGPSILLNTQLNITGGSVKIQVRASGGAVGGIARAAGSRIIVERLS